MTIPWWVLLLVVFIVLSGYMAYRARRAEQKLEQKFIEREGEIYMERLKQEKARKQHSQ